MSTFLKWFENRQQSSTMAAVIKPLAMATEWQVRETHIGREDGAFYRGVVVDVVDGERQWEQFLLQSTAQTRSHGILILAHHKDRFLVQAKAEPGNETPGKVVLTTTVQASFENLKRRRGATFSEYLTHPRLQIWEVPQDGSMFLHKRNSVGLLALKSEEMPHPLPASRYYWAMLNDILTLTASGLVSEFLLQALGLYALFRESR